MPRELAKNTTIDGVTYAAGSSVPDEIAELITNESVWAEGSEKDKPAAPVKKAAAKRSTQK